MTDSVESAGWYHLRMARPLIETRPTVAHPSKMMLERFPVTILLGSQLAAMIVIPAIMKGTQPLGLIVGICAVAVAVALFVELLSQPLVLPQRAPRPISTRATATVLIVGAVAVVASALGGRGTYAVQLGLAQESPIVSIAGPFTVWVVFGTALVFWRFRRGEVSRKAALWVLVGVSALFLWEGLTRAILGQSAALILTLLVLAVFARLIRLRTIVITLLLIPIVWPPLYDLRDAFRRATVEGAVGISANAPLERLQLDTQMAYIERLTPRPDGFEALDLPTLIRIGLIPGFLDPNRPAVDTGSRMSLALGGSASNSQSATMLGNVFVFDGWLGVCVFAVVLTLAMGFLTRRDNPWALAAVGLVYWSAISFNATYPDVVPRVLQALVSMVIAYVVVRMLTPPRLAGP